MTARRKSVYLGKGCPPETRQRKRENEDGETKADVKWRMGLRRGREREREGCKGCEMCCQYSRGRAATMKAAYRLVGANCLTSSCQAVWLLYMTAWRMFGLLFCFQWFYFRVRSCAATPPYLPEGREKKKKKKKRHLSRPLLQTGRRERGRRACARRAGAGVYSRQAIGQRLSGTAMRPNK